MLKNQFKDKLEFDFYVIEQKIRMERGYLSRSEREELKKMLGKDYKPIFIKEQKVKLPIVMDIDKLRQPCSEVTKEDNIKEIIQKLKDTMVSNGGVGLSANQIGIQKRISYIKYPKRTKDNKIEWIEFVLINAKIVEKERIIKINNEQCLSFPGVAVTTSRYVFTVTQYLNEKLEIQTRISQDLESFILQHEIDHQNSLVLFDRKWVAK